MSKKESLITDQLPFGDCTLIVSHTKKDPITVLHHQQLARFYDGKFSNELFNFTQTEEGVVLAEVEHLEDYIKIKFSYHEPQIIVSGGHSNG